MSDNKKYYYLKLKDNFFETEAITILEAMPDGYLYSNILLKLYLKSLKTDGRLMFNERIPYNANMIATITRHQVGTVEKALNIFVEIGLIEILDTGAIYMLDIQNYIGKSSTEADRIRQYRSKINNEKSQKDLIVQMYNKSTPEIEIEKEIEIELEKEICIDDPSSAKALPTPSLSNLRINWEEIKDYFNKNCNCFNSIKSLTHKRKTTIKGFLRENDNNVNELYKLFDMAHKSNFLKGQNEKGWTADFDWIIAPRNRIKILEGNYKNKENKINNQDNPYKNMGVWL